MSNFTRQNLTGERVLVTGTDVAGSSNSVVLDATEWLGIQAHNDFVNAEKNFDQSVEAFFAPLTQAADALSEAAKGKQPDPLSFIVLHEGTEGVEGQPAVVRSLSHDSMVLRLLDAGDWDRLIWVGDDLEILEVIAGTQTQSAVNAVSSTLGGTMIDGGSPQD